jgi:AraC family ethanolamine operon transcriptional activator
MACRSLAVQARAIDDVDALAAAAADGIEAEYVQLEAKPFVARWSVVALPDMVLQFGHEGVAIVRRLRVPAARWAFVIPLVVPDSARWNARPVNGDEVIVCAPGAECYAFDPGGTTFAVISVPDGSAAVNAARALLEGPTTTRTVLPRARDARELQQRLTTVLTGARPRNGAAPRREVDVATALETCLASALPADSQVEASVGRSQIVRRAESFFRRHLGETISIAQLSSIAGVSERSLRNAFYDVYTTSPKRYLRLWQLHQVRRALRRADREDASVTDVATLHGFYELGRFAGEYKALFGEAPSATLQRARGQVASRLYGAA